MSAQASFVAQRFILIESSAIALARLIVEREGPKFVVRIETATALWQELSDR